MEYSKLMSTIEVQYLSQLSHNKEGMRPYMGGGLPLKLAMLPIIGKLPAAHMYRDNGLSSMNEVLSAIDLIIALENKGKNTGELRKAMTRIKVPEDANTGDIHRTTIQGW